MTYSKDVLALNPQLVGEAQAIPASKFHNARTEMRGYAFQSGKEAARAGQLMMLEDAKQIFGLRFQIRFPLAAGIVYVADFEYLDDKLVAHIEDAKGFRTRDYLNKKKLFREKYGKEIEEI